MTSKEIVRRTIEFQDPPRVPLVFWSLILDENVNLSDTPLLSRFFERVRRDDRTSKLVYAGNDIRLLQYAAADGGPTTADAKDGTMVDEWGVKWRDAFPVVHPLDSWDKWPEYRFPDAHAPGRFAGIHKAIAASQDLYLLGLVWNTTFERMWMLRGLENLLTDPFENPRLFFELRDRYLEFNLAVLNKWLQTEVDAIYFGDDVGTQQGLVMSPDMWRRLYLPMYRDLFGRTRAAGKHVFFHSCGHITEIVGDLVDCGLNVLNPVQPNAMDVGPVLKDYGKDLTIWGATDLQERLTFGTPAEIESEIEETASLCWQRGGYIGGTAQGNPPGVPIANLEAFVRAFMRVGGINV